MSILQGIIMGIIQGLTEFLPVSSSGHLALFKLLFNVNTETGLVFDVLLHVGTLVAICIAFHEDILQLITEGFGLLFDLIKNLGIFFFNLFNKDSKKEYVGALKAPYRRFVMLIIVATIPTGIIGFIGKDFVERAQQGLIVPGICLIITAVLLYIADHAESGDNDEVNTSYFKAGGIGIAQGLATLPGLSRSGTTIAACLLCGFKKEFAVKFSFIMSIPAVLGAAVLELKDIGDSAVAASSIPAYVLGTAASAVVGYICIKTMLVLVKKQKFLFFSIYCLIVGITACVAAFVTGMFI